MKLIRLKNGRDINVNYVISMRICNEGTDTKFSSSQKVMLAVQLPDDHEVFIDAYDLGKGALSKEEQIQALREYKDELFNLINEIPDKGVSNQKGVRQFTEFFEEMVLAPIADPIHGFQDNYHWGWANCLLKINAKIQELFPNEIPDKKTTVESYFKTGTPATVQASDHGLG